MGPRAGLELWPAASGPAMGWWLQLGLAGTVKVLPRWLVPSGPAVWKATCPGAGFSNVAAGALCGRVLCSAELSLACSGWREPTNGKWACHEQKSCLSLPVRCYCGIMDDLLSFSSTSALSQAWYCTEVAEGWAACLWAGEGCGVAQLITHHQPLYQSGSTSEGTASQWNSLLPVALRLGGYYQKELCLGLCCLIIFFVTYINACSSKCCTSID